MVYAKSKSKHEPKNLAIAVIAVFCQEIPKTFKITKKNTKTSFSYKIGTKFVLKFYKKKHQFLIKR